MYLNLKRQILFLICCFRLLYLVVYIDCMFFYSNNNNKIYSYRVYITAKCQ